MHGLRRRGNEKEKKERKSKDASHLCRCNVLVITSSLFLIRRLRVVRSASSIIRIISHLITCPRPLYQQLFSSPIALPSPVFGVAVQSRLPKADSGPRLLSRRASKPEHGLPGRVQPIYNDQCIPSDAANYIPVLCANPSHRSSVLISDTPHS